MTPGSWDLSCRDWKQRLRDGRSLVPALPLYPDGERAVAIFNRLRLFDVPGTPTMADAGADWFRDIVRALFGSYDPVAKTRLIRELFLLVSKKQNKTTGGALLMLTALLMNERPRAPFLLTGPVHKTADDAFAAAEGAIALDNVLHKKLHVRDHLKTIIHRETGAKLEIMTFDPDVVTGKKVVGALIDEQHVLGKMPKAGKAMIQLRGGMVPFPEAFLAIITTQSDEAPTGVFDQDLTRAREVRDGKREGRVLPVLYEFPQEFQKDPAKPWRDPKNWPMVMPNLGRSITLQTLIEGCDDAEAKGEAELRIWASQHLNIQIGLALMSDRWSGADHWERNGDPLLTLDALLARSEVVTLGIDAGGSDDLMALAVLGRERDTGRWLAWCHCWVKRSVLELRKSEAPRLEGFQADGDLTITEDLTQQITALAALVEKVRASGLMAEKGIGVDRARIEAILDELNAVGIGDEQVQAVPQNWTLMGPIIACDRKLTEGALKHADQPIMAWAVGNAKVEVHKNAFTITKQASGTAKIDPLMAMLDAAALMARNPESSGSVYEDLAREATA